MIKKVLSGDWYQWEGKDIRKGWWRLNIVQTLFAHEWKWKNENCCNYSRNVEKGIKELLRHWIWLWYILRIFINVTMYPQYNNNIKKEKTDIKRLYILICMLLGMFYCNIYFYQR
jgi:hypothetical protein